MPLPTAPTGFDRATGTVEGRRVCNKCSKLYPVTSHEAQANCPHCGSGNTAPVQNGAYSSTVR